MRENECEAELRGTHSQAELGNDIGLMGALLPFVLRAVAGACVGRGSGQPRMPPQERQHEGLEVGGFNPLRGATTGVVMRRRATTGVDGTRAAGVTARAPPHSHSDPTAFLSSGHFAPQKNGFNAGRLNATLQARK